MTTSRKRWWIVGLAALGLVGAELGLRMARRPSAGLVLINGGTAPIRGLVVSYHGVDVVVGDLAPDALKVVRLDVRPEDAVAIGFEQEGNPSPGARIGGGELVQARRDGLRVGLTFQPGQVVRFVEDDEQVDRSPLARLWRRAYDALFATPRP